MLALLQRAQAAHEAAAAAAAPASNGSGNGNGQSLPQQQQQQQQQQQNPVHLQMPQQFVGVTGVYDIAKHYAYEKDRGVHSLSTMLPAMGGFQHFAANSPSVILGAALQQQQQQQQQQAVLESYKQQQQQDASSPAYKQNLEQQEQQQQLEQQELPACHFYSSFSLSGESIAHRIGEGSRSLLVPLFTDSELAYRTQAWAGHVAPRMPSSRAHNVLSCFWPRRT
jgi:flagellar motor protein MotB